MNQDRANKSIVLASASPRRIEMLRDAGFNLSIMPAEIDEIIDDTLSSEDIVMNLSLQKALSVKQKIKADISGLASSSDAEMEDVLIVGADTIVYLDDIIGKPKDREDALEILLKLSGKAHQVFTGVSILSLLTDKHVVFFEETKVFFKEYSAHDLEEYLNTDEPYDKAGAYAIQGYFSRFIDHIEGDYNNVVGLPLKSLCLAISDF